MIVTVQPFSPNKVKPTSKLVVRLYSCRKAELLQKLKKYQKTVDETEKLN